MNRFRVNLHPALFDPFESRYANGDLYNKEDYDANKDQFDLGNIKEVVIRGDKTLYEKKQEELEAAELKQEMELNALKAPILEEFKDSTDDFFTEVNTNQEQSILSRYVDRADLKGDHKRFMDRISKNNKNKEGKSYCNIWDENITNGFGHLIGELQNNGYFDDKDLKTEMPKIKDLYWKEVKRQYVDNVWFAGDKKFERVKDVLFSRESGKDYPANKIYCELTGAPTIFKVDRQSIEGYDSVILDMTDIDENAESGTDRQNRNFLSDDLPMYLWNVRKAPGALLNWLPIVHVKVDKPSKEDRKAIRNFLKLSSKIQLKEGDNRDKAVALIEAFKDNRLNTNKTEKDYESVLRNHGITVDKKYLDNILRAGNFFIRTQSVKNSPENQHAIYLSVLQIIEKEGGVDAAVSKFKNIVEGAKADKKIQKKEGYESGEKLMKADPRLYWAARNLGMTDFTSATNLLDRKDEYFRNTSLDKILANLNNDNTLDARDSIMGGTKSGKQFQEIFNQIGEDKALSNLLHHAKLVNKTLGIDAGLNDSVFDDVNIAKEKIKGGDRSLILLLQNVINKPGEDLYTLLSKDVTKDPFEGLDLNAEKVKIDEYAKELAGKMDVNAIKNLGINLPSPEEIQTGLANAIYTEYKRGVGLGGKVSFDQWIKGMSMNTGFQVRNDGTVVVGLGLNYRKDVNLGKGWTMTPALSGGTFLALGDGKPKLDGSVALSNEVAKTWLDKNGVAQKFGIGASVTKMATGALVISVGPRWSQDRLGPISELEREKVVEFKDKIMGSILAKALEKRQNSSKDAKINFNDPEWIKTLKDSISEVANSKDKEGNILVPAKDQKMVTDAVMRLLVNYNNVDLSNQAERDIIAQGVAEQYAMAWSEAKKAGISKKAFVSGVGLGVFWTVGSPLVGIHLGVDVTKHDLDGYGDRWGAARKLDNSNNTGWNKDTIKLLNERLGLSDKNGLEFSDDGYISIPKSLTHKIKVSGDMKGLMKRENGSVTLSQWTTMRESIMQGAATKSKELLIGAGPDFKTHLDVAGGEWFADDLKAIDTSVVEKANEKLYNPEMIKKAIAKFKVKHEGLKDFNPTEEEVNKLVADMKALDAKDKRIKITVEKKSDGKIVMSPSKTENQGKGIELEYRINLEMFDSKAKELADKVYERAAKLDNPGALNKIKHPVGKEMQAYKDFVAKLNGKDYEGAKSELIKVITKLNESYTGEKAFPTPAEWPTGEALGQLLMSINNVFARSARVKGKGSVEGLNQYEFTTQMGSIVEEREIQIGSTLDKKLSPQDAAIYKKLIAATKKYREQYKAELNYTSAQAAHLNNTVGFNLGDQTNPENPLLNPEIYQYGMMDSAKLVECGFSLEEQNALHTRAINKFITNNALFNPLKRALGLDESATVKIAEGAELNNGKIKLDIGGKKVTLSSDMKFGYFTQCVNHTVILDNISVEDENGNIMNFGSGSWENGRYVEGNKSSIVATTTFSADIAFVVGKKGGDGTTTPEEEEEDISDGTTIPDEEESDIKPKTDPGNTDEGQADGYNGGTGVGGQGQGGSQGGEREGNGGGNDKGQPNQGGKGHSGGGVGGGKKRGKSK